MLRGRPRKVRIAKKARTKAFGHAVKGAGTPAQVRAALKREIARPRKQWMRSRAFSRRY